MARQPKNNGTSAAPQFLNGSEHIEKVKGKLCMGEKTECRNTEFIKIKA